MKIAYIISPFVVVDGLSNGIRSQALTWGEALKANGHQVDYIDSWGIYDWPSYDAVHFFGNGPWVNTIRTYLRKKNPRCVYSPIYDPSPFHESRSQRWQKVISKLTHGKWHSALHSVCLEYTGYQKVLVRTQHEHQMVHNLFDVPESQIANVPLSYSNGLSFEQPLPEKEPFVFHMSLFTQPRKNVIRLVKAAKKYNFRLVIAGNPGTKDAYDDFLKAVGDAPNIQVLGFIGEEQKIDLYRRARVFALPSISEGVGIVAVDAALYGADIVVTNIGGPKEYYNGMAEVVDPYSVDEIGEACMRLLSGKTYQPQLRQYIHNNCSLSAIVDKLVEAYSSL
ncbi:MAG: glycosyltransferase family 4 protein [Bacteroidales bacterium]|nr:glycosyltransferase family 4 protein [Bacteroidales bacterium]